jgi:hypothetical protein
MEVKKKICSNIEHGEIIAITFCAKCQIYLCNKCETTHSKLFRNHSSFIFDAENEDIFTGFCQNENHQIELEYFCKSHNELCCADCLSKIKLKSNGKHKDCDVCCLEDIKNQKEKELKENIKYLEELSNNFQKSFNDLKNIFEKINENKEELKSKILKIFTKIRNELNNREDELLSEVDKYFDNIYFNKNIIKEGEELPNRIKNSLEKSKSIDMRENNKLSLKIHECINIENIIKDIKAINENLNKCKKTINIQIKFYPENERNIKIFIDFLKNLEKF